MISTNPTFHFVTDWPDKIITELCTHNDSFNEILTLHYTLYLWLIYDF